MTQLAESYTLCKMSNGHFTVQLTAEEISGYKTKKVIRIKNSERLRI